MTRLPLLALALLLLQAPRPGAAAEENGEALFAEAVRNEMGQGLPVDLAKAQGLYCRAARLGHVRAAFQVGWFYWTGLGVPADPVRGFSWIAAAAQAGDLEARRTLRMLPIRPSAAGSAAIRPDCQSARPRPPLEVRPASRRDAPPIPDSRQFRALAARGAIADAVRDLAPRFALDPELVLAVIAVESNFDPSAVSPKRAQGLMQLMPETARRFGVADPLEPAGNLLGGMGYLRWLLAYYRGDVRLALAGYNAGEGAVDRYGGIPPFDETRTYVRRVGGLYPATRHPFDGAVTEGSALLTRGPATGERRF